MPGSNKYNGDSNHIPGRVERLLRDRELRKRGSENNDSLEQDHQEIDDVENVSSSSSISETRQQQGDDVVGKYGRNNNRQRLLVVANRLPVSAIRKGEDSWSLEISAGGLVSALLGMYHQFIRFLCNTDTSENLKNRYISMVSCFIVSFYLLMVLI